MVIGYRGLKERAGQSAPRFPFRQQSVCAPESIDDMPQSSRDAVIVLPDSTFCRMQPTKDNGSVKFRVLAVLAVARMRILVTLASSRLVQRYSDDVLLVVVELLKNRNESPCFLRIERSRAGIVQTQSQRRTAQQSRMDR